jgi:hypothetical protein
MRHGRRTSAAVPTPSWDHSRFSDPREVVDSQTLEPEEKRRILLDWLRDERALLVADDEGMVGSRPTREDQVREALRALSELGGFRASVHRAPEGILASRRHEHPTCGTAPRRTGDPLDGH